MSHGIMENDKGIVQGSTWHKIESYIQQAEPVTIEQAREVLDYSIWKRELVVDRGEGLVSTGVFEAYREDTGDVLIPSCTESYNIINNVKLLDNLNTKVLEQSNGKVTIESCGTLFNGQTAFVNLLLGEYRIKGDSSETLNRLMYYNPLGKGSYRTCAHNIRVVCNNTLRASEAQGKANDTLVKVAHTKNAEVKLEAAIETILDIKAGFDIFQDKLTHLTTQQFDRQADLVDFVTDRWFYGNPTEKSVAKVVNRVEAVYNDTRDEYAKGIQGSKYQLLQAYTNVIDGPSKKSDAAYRSFDGMVGIRAGLKDKALDHLLN